MPSDEAKAMAVEATKPEFIEFEFNGETYNVPGDVEEYDIEVVEAFENDDSIGAIRGLLGPQQWKLIKKRGLKVKDFNSLVEVVLKTIGLSEGK